MSKKVEYDPVTAPVPGVDQDLKEIELNDFNKAGDPLPSKTINSEKKVIFSLKKLGIKIIR